MQERRAIEVNVGHLAQLQTYFFDLDGCVYYGDQPAPGARELLERLRSEGRNVGFITNNSRQTAEEVAAKLRRFGIRVAPGEIVTAADAVGYYLAERYGKAKVKVAGSEALRKSIAACGHAVLSDRSDERADFVAVSRDVDFTYEKLQWIAAESARGAMIVAANPDLHHPGVDGIRVPETGALVAAIEAVCSTAAEIIGKPEPYLFVRGMRLHGSSPEQCIMVGDNAETDIRGARRAGMRSIWLAGDHTPVGLGQTDLAPDLIVRNMRELYEWYTLAVNGRMRLPMTGE
ncbi:HAD-IIA family hydrolase [Paenibacillus hodogayensis]|uniref:HAD-IIA family hydrolase n=1 Tax=Paenibacillus hodogayensis TaxID=279208 RepID=A0ABV5W319_9BACL